MRKFKRGNSKQALKGGLWKLETCDYGIGYTLQSLEIVDAQLAIAMVNIPLNSGHYIDCLELQKIDGHWKIVLKSFVFFPKK
nr:nuclear transport factor 2 family protein [Allomuricauda sp.]